MKSAIRTLKLVLTSAHLGRESILRTLVWDAVRCRVSELSHLSALRFAPFTTRLCHLHFAPQAFSKARVLVVGSLVVCFFAGLHSRGCFSFEFAQPGTFDLQYFAELHSLV